MSGPKCSQYELDQRIARQQADAEEARRKEAERQRLEELRHIREWTEKIDLQVQSLLKVNSSLSDARSRFGHDISSQPLVLPPMPSRLSSATLQAHFELLQGIKSQANQVEQEIAHVTANAGMRQIIQDTSAHIMDDVASVEEYLDNMHSLTARSTPSTRDEREALANQLVGRLTPAEWTDEVKRMLGIFLDEAHAPRVGLLEKELRRVIQRARQEFAQKKQDQADSEMLLLQLPTVEVPDLEELREDLHRAACGLIPLDSVLRHRVSTAQLTAKTALVEKCAGEIAAAALRDLGFLIDESFSTLFVDGGEVFFQRPGSNEYFVSLDIDKESQQITLRAVRDGNSEAPLTHEAALRDGEAEESFCSDFPKIMSALSRGGIRTRLVSAGKPGAKEVEVLDLGVASRTKRRMSRNSKPRSHAKHDK